MIVQSELSVLARQQQNFAARCVTAILLLSVARQGYTQQTWFDSLPDSVREQIIWNADYESGQLDDWIRTDPMSESGSGIFNTGGDEVWAKPTQQIAHSGRWCMETHVQGAVQAKHGNRAVRLMIWTDRPWSDGGKHLPLDAYYSTWIYFPYRYSPEKDPAWDPGDGGWWNVFQFKTEDKNGTSQPAFSLNVASDKQQGMCFYLYSPINGQRSWQQPMPRYFRERQWIHVEAFYRSAKDGLGRIIIFQNGLEILNAEEITTSLGGTSGDDLHPIWGIGSYTDHIAGDPEGVGRATIYFDDSAISKAPLSRFTTSQRLVP